MGRRVGTEFTWSDGIYRVCQIIIIGPLNNFFKFQEEAINAFLIMLEYYSKGFDEIAQRINKNDVTKSLL